MDRADRGSLKLTSHSLSYPNIKQQLSKTMSHPSGCDRTVNTILQKALSNPDSLSVLSDLASILGKLLTADFCFVVAAQTEGSPRDRVGFGQEKSPSAAVVRELSLLPLAQDSNLPVSLKPTSLLHEAIERLVATNFPDRVWQAKITQFQQRPNGLVLFISAKFSDLQQAKELPESIVNASAIAISQAQLQHQSQTKSRYQQLFKNLSREICQGDRPQVLFQNCLAEICRTMQLDRGIVLMFKYQNPLKAKDRSQNSVKGRAKITCQWSSSPKSPLSDKSAFDLKDSALCQQAWRQAPECLSFNSQTAFPDLEVEELETQGSALLMMPIMGRQTSETDSATILGLLVLQSDLPLFWSADELNTADWVGTQMSTAITLDRTLSRVQLMVEERTAQLKSSMDMQGMLSNKMRQHIQQLQRVNQLKDDFMNSMSHELKTPLTSMKIAIKMLRQPHLTPEMRERYLDILEQEWNREYNLIKDLLTLQQVESGELDYSPQELDLGQTIADLSQTFKDKWQSDRDLNFVCKITPPDLKIHTDAESFKHILQELLANAGKYCDVSTNIEMVVSSRTKAHSEEIEISVSNVGTGITPEELPYIFDKFRRGQGVTDRAVPGTGLGLTLVQYLVEHLNGKIEVESQPLDEAKTSFSTTFTIKLPQIQPSIA